MTILKHAKTKKGSDQVIMKCEICQVVCTGVQTYEAHISGKSHKKCEELLKKLKESSVGCEMKQEVNYEFMAGKITSFNPRSHVNNFKPY